MNETAFKTLLILLLLAAIVYVFKGFRKVDLGAVGVVVWLGRRTGHVRPEGLTWVAPILGALQEIYVRERQITLLPRDFYTADRVRIKFKLTLRVLVADAGALFSQGRGTYEPFTREARYDKDQGAEEANLPFQRMVENAVRETVQRLRIDDVMFGGRASADFGRRVHDELRRTVQRWGLDVVEIWLTDVDAEDAAMKQAVQSEARESMAGKGRVAGFEADVSRGAAFHRVAADLVLEIEQRTGSRIPQAEALEFLTRFYRTDRELDVAVRAAGTENNPLNLLYLSYFGAALPALQAPAGGPRLPAAGGGSRATPHASWVIGREGDLVVDGDGVSRRHARIEVLDGRMTLTDLGSTNGTFVNGERLSPNSPTSVGAADTVQFGRQVRFRGDEILGAAGRADAGTRGPGSS